MYSGSMSADAALPGVIARPRARNVASDPSSSPDNRFAYVTLQEVNGVAVIDLTNPGTAPIAIQP
jgi:hypothetical protein